MEVRLTKTKDVSIVSIRERVDVSNIGGQISKAFDLLVKKGAICVGLPIAIYHSAYFAPENTDVEVGFPVSASSDYTRVLAGCTCASCIHRGDYSRINETYGELLAWIEDNGYTICGTPFERYLNNPLEVQTEDLLTEVNFPVTK